MPNLAVGLVALAAVVALVVVLTRPSGTNEAESGEVFLQPVNEVGPDPFTESTVVGEATSPPESTPPPQPPPPPAKTTGPGSGTPQTPYETRHSTAPPPTGKTTATRSISGAAPGVYGGTKDMPSCDVEKQIRGLAGQPAKNSAFAASVGVTPSEVPGYLRSLTPVQLGLDTRVTNHGYREGKSNAYQAVLQTGTAVMVDDRGLPRVRCACGNPLGGPVALKATPKRYGRPWATYQPAKVVVIAPSVKIVKKFVIYDHHKKRWYEREHGQHHKGRYDRPIPPPVVSTPTWSTGTPTHPWTPTDSPTGKPPSDGTRTGKTTTEPPTEGTKSGKTTTEPPTEGATTEPPTEGATTEPPTEGATTEPPTEGATTEPPTEGATTEPPTEGATTEPPTEGTTTEPPTSPGESSAPPPETSAPRPDVTTYEAPETSAPPQTQPEHPPVTETPQEEVPANPYEGGDGGDGGDE